MERARQGVFALCLLLSFSTRGSSQTVAEMANLQGALPVEMSPDGSTLWYRIGQGSRLLDGVWEISVSAGGAPRLSNHSVPKAEPALVIPGSPEASNVRRSPDGKEIAYLKERSLYCSCKRSPDGKPSAVSGKSILAFEWADTSKAFWVIAGDGPDEPVGLLKVDGHFEQVTKTPALRRRGGFVAAGGSVAWVESDGSHYGSIWTRDRQGRVRMRVDLNPQLANWTLGKQEVIRWKNSFGEELHGILVRPGGKRSPLIVDPYSSGRNGFLNTTLLGNYIFVKEGFAVFLPNHRAPHTLPAAMFGSDYVGSAKNRDPVDVLVDDVMSGVNVLIARGIADPDRMFLYGFSNGASSVDQLLTQTHAFRAAVSNGGVADWLQWYRDRFATAGDLIAEFLGGRRPEDSPDLYRRISAFYQVDKIKTPLLLAIGEQDTRFPDTMRFYDALRNAGAPVTLVTYPGEGHGLNQKNAEDYINRTLELFRSHMNSKESKQER